MHANTHIHTNIHTQIHPAADLFKTRTGEHKTPISYYAGISQTPAIVYRAPMGPYYQWHHQALCSPQQHTAAERERVLQKKDTRETKSKVERKRKQGKWEEKIAMGETNRVGRCDEQGGKWKKLVDNSWTDRSNSRRTDNESHVRSEKKQIIQEEWVLEKHLLLVWNHFRGYCFEGMTWTLR